MKPSQTGLITEEFMASGFFLWEEDKDSCTIQCTPDKTDVIEKCVEALRGSGIVSLEINFFSQNQK